MYQIAKVKNIKKLYKNDVEANSVELIVFNSKDYKDYEVVHKKGEFTIGDYAIFIEPDVCLPDDDPLFDSFTKRTPSMLGTYNRIRAIKFNLSKEPNGQSIYSNGILIPVKIVKDGVDYEYFAKNLKLQKYSDIENELDFNRITVKRTPKSQLLPFPKNIYKTDEINIDKTIHVPNKVITYRFTKKYDGASITIGITDDYPEGFICSRNYSIQLHVKQKIGVRSKTWLEKLMFWTKPDLNVYKEVPNNDNIYVKAGYKYLQLLKQLGYKNIILRGELIGKESRGSGNKINPDRDLDTQIVFYGIDSYKDGKANRLAYYDDFNFTNFPFVECLGYYNCSNKKDLIEFSKFLIDDYKKNKNQIIEGLVIRDVSNNIDFSCKYINPEYDSKK